MSPVLNICGTDAMRWTKPFSVLQRLKQWQVRGQAAYRQNLRTISILCTDIVSFSHRLAHLSPKGQAKLARDITTQYYPLLKKVVRCHRGQVNNFLGDGMLAIFESADHAVSAAVSLQQAVTEFNQTRFVEHLNVFPTRIVVHHGDVYVMSRSRWCAFGSPTYLGEAINTAFYLAKLVPPSRVFISSNILTSLSGQSKSQLWQTVPNKGTRHLLEVYEITDFSKG